MEYFRSDGAFPRLSDSAVTLGKFDGVHRGHKKLISRVLEKKEEGLQAVVFAFTSSEKMIITRKERSGLLERLDVSYDQRSAAVIERSIGQRLDSDLRAVAGRISHSDSNNRSFVHSFILSIWRR